MEGNVVSCYEHGSNPAPVLFEKGKAMDDILEAVLEKFEAYNLQDPEMARVLAELKKGES